MPLLVKTGFLLLALVAELAHAQLPPDQNCAWVLVHPRDGITVAEVDGVTYGYQPGEWTQITYGMYRVGAPFAAIRNVSVRDAEKLHKKWRARTGFWDLVCLIFDPDISTKLVGEIGAAIRKTLNGPHGATGLAYVKFRFFAPGKTINPTLFDLALVRAKELQLPEIVALFEDVLASRPAIEKVRMALNGIEPLLGGDEQFDTFALFAGNEGVSEALVRLGRSADAAQIVAGLEPASMLRYAFPDAQWYIQAWIDAL